MTSKEKVYEVIFGTETPAGKIFDVLLLATILFSVLIVSLESVATLSLKYGHIFSILEWSLTILFTLEYLLRIYSSSSPKRYIFSFFGIVDLLSILPSYLELFLIDSHFFLVIRSLRLLRVFRILKLVRYLYAAHELSLALRASRQKIFVFIVSVVIIALLSGTLMYIVEGAEGGFTSIPRGLYWAIVTLTTVGYGDISPVTPLGQALSSLLMILGYGIIAVPTGIISAEMTAISRHNLTQICPQCFQKIHDEDALFCKYCGSQLSPR